MCGNLKNMFTIFYIFFAFNKWNITLSLWVEYGRSDIISFVIIGYKNLAASISRTKSPLSEVIHSWGIKLSLVRALGQLRESPAWWRTEISSQQPTKNLRLPTSKWVSLEVDPAHTSPQSSFQVTAALANNSWLQLQERPSWARTT